MEAALELELGPVPGLWVEDKGLSLAIHYRQYAQKADARRRILAVTRKLKRARYSAASKWSTWWRWRSNKGDAVAADGSPQVQLGLIRRG